MWTSRPKSLTKRRGGTTLQGMKPATSSKDVEHRTAPRYNRGLGRRIEVRENKGFPQVRSPNEPGNPRRRINKGFFGTEPRLKSGQAHLCAYEQRIFNFEPRNEPTSLRRSATRKRENLAPRATGGGASHGRGADGRDQAVQAGDPGHVEEGGPRTVSGRQETRQASRRLPAVDPGPLFFADGDAVQAGRVAARV
jgi:hypothetical protein